MYKKKKQDDKCGPSRGPIELEEQDLNIRKIVEVIVILANLSIFGSSHMTWKNRKDMENKKIVSLGGKPAKKQRLPLGVAGPMMKKQKQRDQKMQEEQMILGRFGGKHSGNGKRPVGKCKPEDRILKAAEDRFRNGVLDVKHLLRSAPSRESNSSIIAFSKGRRKEGKRNNVRTVLVTGKRHCAHPRWGFFFP